MSIVFHVKATLLYALVSSDNVSKLCNPLEGYRFEYMALPAFFFKLDGVILLKR